MVGSGLLYDIFSARCRYLSCPACLLDCTIVSALDHLTVKELNSAWKGGRFSHWFGGPRAGRYMTCTLEARLRVATVAQACFWDSRKGASAKARLVGLQDLWSWDFKRVFETVVQMQVPSCFKCTMER